MLWAGAWVGARCRSWHCQSVGLLLLYTAISSDMSSIPSNFHSYSFGTKEAEGKVRICVQNMSQSKSFDSIPHLTSLVPMGTSPLPKTNTVQSQMVLEQTSPTVLRWGNWRRRGKFWRSSPYPLILLLCCCRKYPSLQLSFSFALRTRGRFAHTEGGAWECVLVWTHESPHAHLHS